MDKQLGKIACGVLVCAVLGLCVLGGFGIKYPQVFVANGPWGDFFGGVANPLLTFLTFGAVLVTLWLQQQELALSRTELSRSASALEKQIEAVEVQRREATFFQMLALHNQIVNSIDLQSVENFEQKGRDCFTTFYDRLGKIYKRNMINKVYNNEIIVRTYSEFWKRHQPELGHYYRYLFRTVKYTARSFPLDDTYIAILRAQLSDGELLLLFYNSLSPDGEAFKGVIEEWALLDNMPRVKLLHPSHEQLLSPSAYDSGLARQKRIQEPSAPGCAA